MMNEKIKELGCTESHFANPSGLSNSDQYVTAYDMALIGQAAYNNKELLKISSTITYKTAPTTNNPNGKTLQIPQVSSTRRPLSPEKPVTPRLPEIRL